MMTPKLINCFYCQETSFFLNISVSILTGKGVPDKRMEEINKKFILPSIDMFPTGEEAVSAYERDGGNLRSPEVFGTDILAGNQQLQQLRFDNFNAAYPCFEVIFYCLVNGDHHPFREGLMNFIDLTNYSI